MFIISSLQSSVSEFWEKIELYGVNYIFTINIRNRDKETSISIPQESLQISFMKQRSKSSKTALLSNISSAYIIDAIFTPRLKLFLPPSFSKLFRQFTSRNIRYSALEEKRNWILENMMHKTLVKPLFLELFLQNRLTIHDIDCLSERVRSLFGDGLAFANSHAIIFTFFPVATYIFALLR